MATAYRRRRRPHRGRNQGVNNNQAVDEDPALVWLSRKLCPRDITLPITTRGIGMSVCSLVKECSFYDYVSEDSDEDEVIIRMPDIYALYRLCLGLLECKLWKLKACSPEDTYQYVASPDLTNYIRSYWLPKEIQRLIQAVGVFEHNGTTYIPAVVKDTEGVPLPENLLLSNLRRAVELLSSLQTPIEHREYFYKHNPIPGAVWDKVTYRLINADDIIQAGYHDNFVTNINTDYNKCSYCFNDLRRYSKKMPKFTGGPVDLTCKGEKSLLISNKTETLRVPDRASGTQLSSYCKTCYLHRDIYDTDYYALSTMSGATIRMLGEYPDRNTCVDPLYKLRSDVVAGFRVCVGSTMEIPLPVERIITRSPMVPLTLSVTTRGIGMSICRLLNMSSVYCSIAAPDIHALFRLCLGLLEAKLSNMYNVGSVVKTYRYKENADITRIAEVSWVPKEISRLINTVCKFEHDGITYVPAVAKDVTNPQGTVPRPENLLLSNLRRAVDFLSDPNTPVEHREYFYKHNPIPGAEWDKERYLLQNPDDIIQADYYDNHAGNFRNDNMACKVYFSRLNNYSARIPEFTSERIDIDSTLQEPLHSLLVSNEIGNIRVADKATDEEPSSYCKRCRPEGDVKHYHALSRLSAEDILYGTTSLLGEYPKIDINDPIYNLRSETIARFTVHATYSQAVHVLNNVV